MCGEIPKGHSAVDVVVCLPTNTPSLVVNLPRQFMNVREIRLREYFMQGATAGAYRVKFVNDQVTAEQTNAGGDGLIFAVDTNENLIHYDNPRTVALYERGSLTNLNVVVSRVNPADLAAAAVPNFTLAYFLITIVTKDEVYDRSFVNTLHTGDEVYRPQLPFNQNMPFMHVGKMQ